MSAESSPAVQLSDADMDALVDALRRAGRPFPLAELVTVLQDIWRRRRESR
jgi:hypothetical protein